MEYIQKALNMKHQGLSLREIQKELRLENLPYKTFQSQLLRAEKRVKKEPLDKTPIEDKILKYLKNGATIDEMAEGTQLSERVVQATINVLIEDGYNIKDLFGMYILDTNQMPTNEEIKEDWKGETEIVFGVVSDTHLCSKYQQISFLKDYYNELQRRGIKTVYHCGDLSDGFYKNRDQQIYEIFEHGVDNQADYIIENYPKVEGITTKFIIGNHDNTHILNGGANIGKRIAREREDMQYLGHSFAKVWLTPKCDLDLVHPIDGSAYALSYAGQKYLDSLNGGEKPKIVAMGHHHKFFYMFYRNVHFLEVPTTQAQTPFMKGKKLAAYMGGLVCKVNVDSEGTIKNFNVELIPIYKALEDDF